MITVTRRFTEVALIVIAVITFGVAVAVGFGLAGADSTAPQPLNSQSANAPQSPSEPCISGIWVYNPYVVNCNLQRQGPHILGQAPDAGALIACRDNKQCLSLYVNGGYGWYPGATLTPSYRP